MTSTGLARRGSNFIPVETKETSELSSSLNDRSGSRRRGASDLPCVNDIPAIYAFSRC